MSPFQAKKRNFAGLSYKSDNQSGECEGEQLIDMSDHFSFAGLT
jgi:hypothetical protein